MVHVEVAPGVVTVVAAWMLDATACVGMEIGAPRVAVPALADLHRLLATLGFRTEFRDDSTVALGSSNEINTAESAAITAADGNAAGRQEPMGMTTLEREIAVSALARLLLESAGTSAEENRDDHG